MPYTRHIPTFEMGTTKEAPPKRGQMREEERAQ
jgi:hypothetical protein